jgi:hypothetical protein
VAIVATLVGVSNGTARADTYSPAAPYNHLHPPAGLARQNKKPTSAHTTARLSHGLTTIEFLLFTKDGQAGIYARPRGLGAGSPAKTLDFTIRPVNTPRGLPSQYLTNGNAYSFSGVGKPGHRPMTQKYGFTIVLRWPHGPSAVYVFQNKRWRQLCSYDHWILSLSTVACHAYSLGTFQAVRLPAKAKA